MTDGRWLVLFVTLLATIAIVPTVGLATHEADKPVETQYTFRVDLGDEVYGEEDVHHPGGTDGSVVIYLTGAPESFDLSYLVTYSPLDTTDCETTDIAAGGIDRGNDDQYTETDTSLIGAYEGTGNKSSQDSDLGPEDDPGPIAPEGHEFRSSSYVDFWEDEDFGGDATTFNPEDEGILALRDCVRGPTVPGWYRGWGKVNGTSTATGELVSIPAFSNWNYVCECDSYDEAIETIGPPPAGYTVEEGQTSGGGSPATETPEPTATPTATQTPTATRTQTVTATATPGPTATAAPTATPTVQQTTAGGPTVTGGDGPGFGALVAVMAVVAVALIARRRG